MKKLIKFLIISLSFLMIGCATTVKSLQPGAVVDNKEQYSYLYGTCQRPFLGLQYEIISPEFNIFVKYKDNTKNIEKYKLSYDMKKRNEKGLYLFKIKPGKYTIYQMELEGYKKTTDINFDVKEDTVYYLGFINFEQDLLNILGNSISVKLSNDEQSDKKLLLEKYMFLEKSKFEFPSIK